MDGRISPLRAVALSEPEAWRIAEGFVFLRLPLKLFNDLTVHRSRFTNHVQRCNGSSVVLRHFSSFLRPRTSVF